MSVKVIRALLLGAETVTARVADRIAAGDVVVVLVEDVAKLVDQNRAKRLIACIQSGLSKVDTEAQVIVIGSG